MGLAWRRAALQERVEQVTSPVGLAWRQVASQERVQQCRPQAMPGPSPREAQEDPGPSPRRGPGGPGPEPQVGEEGKGVLEPGKAVHMLHFLKNEVGRGWSHRPDKESNSQGGGKDCDLGTA